MAITGAVAVIGVGMASIIFMIHQATTEVREMNVELVQLKTTVAQLPKLQNRAQDMNARINELDIGMLAMAKMLKLDGAELSRLMKSDMFGTELHSAAEVEQAPAIELKARGTPTDEADPSGTPWAIAAQNPEANGEVGGMPPTIADVDGVLIKRIGSNWNIPAGDIDDLRTELELKLTREGRMSTVKVVKSSGNRMFDDSAVSAIMRIESIPEVASLTDDLYRVGYESRSIVFTPDLGGS
jgi:outer membrane murein-binding lipoprotein Lpp